MTPTAVTDAPAVEPTRNPLADKFFHLDPAWLFESEHNPRRHFDEAKLAELAESIRQKGIVEPLVVRERPYVEAGAPRFEIVAGARRYRAAKLAGLDSVPCIVRDYSDEDVLEIFVVENLQRDDLSPLEQARGFQQLLTTNADRFSVATIAGKVGMSPAWVWDRLRLLNLIPEAQELLEQGRISVGHAIVLARLKPADQVRAIDPSDGGLWVAEETGALFDEDDEAQDLVDDWQDLKPRSIRELEAWVAGHVRFDVQHMAQAVPLQFGDVAELVEAAEASPARGKKVVSITFEHFVQPEAKDPADRTYGPKSWHRADGTKGSTECDHSVLGVVVVGPQQGRAFDVCIARDKCEVHFAEELKAKREAEKARAKGDTATAKKVEKKQEATWQRQQREREERRKVWEPQKGPVMAAALAQVQNFKALTPKHAAYFEDNGEFYIDTSAARRLLGKTWFKELAAAALVSEISKCEYIESFDAFVKEYAEPLGLNLKPLIAARDAHSPKPEAAASAKKTAKKAAKKR